jgi:tetratricopeptide (TPR) repeat protein
MQFFPMVRGEQLTDAIVYDKLNLLKKDFSGYIERNTAKVDENLPVFFGHMISALEKSFPDITDELYDEFVDSITFQVLDASSNINDFDYIKRVILNALRLKKRKNADIGVNLVVGLKLLKHGDYGHALDFLKKYAELDAKIGMAVAYCQYELSLKEFKKEENLQRNQRPGEMELLARETLLNLARIKPQVNQLRQLDVNDPAFLEKCFWQMIFLGIEWFPSEIWFIEVGLKNAKIMENAELKKRLLEIGSERFYTDMVFLREMYYFKLENRDAAGAAGVVNQLMKHYPDDLEPVYLGLKLSLLLTKKITYQSFRKMATTKGMPASIIELFDLSFDLLNQDKKAAMLRITEFEREFPHYQYYVTTLRYIAADFFSDNESRVKRARKALIDSIEQYCTEELKKRK